MAASLFIEEESGTSRGWVHPHNGYSSGCFSGSGVRWTDTEWTDSAAGES